MGNPEAARRFKSAWSEPREGGRPLLCYNSGRLVDDILRLLESEPLPVPDYIVGGVGTQLYDVARAQAVVEFDEQYRQGWDLERIEQILAAFPGVTRQPPEFLHPYKSSWYLDQASAEALDSLRARLAASGLKVSLVYSSSRDLDILPNTLTPERHLGYAVQWFGLALGFIGVTLVIGGKFGLQAELGPMLIPVLAALLGITVGTLYQKRFCSGFDLRTGSVIQFVPSAILTAVAIFLFTDFQIDWTPEFIFALGWLVLVLSIGAISLLNVLIHSGSAVNVASLFYLVPLLSLIHI